MLLAEGDLNVLRRRQHNLSRASRAIPAKLFRGRGCRLGLSLIGTGARLLLVSQRLWCSLAQLTSTVPEPIASKAPSMPIVPM